MSLGIESISAKHMGRIDPNHPPIWINIRKSKRSDGVIHCLTRDQAIRLRDHLDMAIAELDEATPPQTTMQAVFEPVDAATGPAGGGEETSGTPNYSPVAATFKDVRRHIESFDESAPDETEVTICNNTSDRCETYSLGYWRRWLNRWLVAMRQNARWG